MKKEPYGPDPDRFPNLSQSTLAKIAGYLDWPHLDQVSKLVPVHGSQRDKVMKKFSHSGGNHTDIFGGCHSQKQQVQSI